MKHNTMTIGDAQELISEFFPEEDHVDVRIGRDVQIYVGDSIDGLYFEGDTIDEAIKSALIFTLVSPMFDESGAAAPGLSLSGK